MHNLTYLLSPYESIISINWSIHLHPLSSLILLLSIAMAIVSSCLCVMVYNIPNRD